MQRMASVKADDSSSRERGCHHSCVRKSSSGTLAKIFPFSIFCRNERVRTNASRKCFRSSESQSTARITQSSKVNVGTQTWVTEPTSNNSFVAKTIFFDGKKRDLEQPRSPSNDLLRLRTWSKSSDAADFFDAGSIRRAFSPRTPLTTRNSLFKRTNAKNGEDENSEPTSFYHVHDGPSKLTHRVVEWSKHLRPVNSRAYFDFKMRRLEDTDDRTSEGDFVLPGRNLASLTIEDDKPTIGRITRPHQPPRNKSDRKTATASKCEDRPENVDTLKLEEPASSSTACLASRKMIRAIIAVAFATAAMFLILFLVRSLELGEIGGTISPFFSKSPPIDIRYGSESHDLSHSPSGQDDNSVFKCERYDRVEYCDRQLEALSSEYEKVRENADELFVSHDIKKIIRRLKERKIHNDAHAIRQLR